jgi:hypothetical protein
VDDDLARTPEGWIDFGVLLEDPEIADAIWRDSVEFWPFVDPDGSIRRRLRES